jgi:hypothetical protein
MFRHMIIRNADVVFLTQDILQPQAFHMPALEQGNAVVPSSGYEYQSASDQTAGRLQTMRPVRALPDLLRAPQAKGACWVWTHLGLAKDTPASRPTEMGSARERKIQSFPRLGGLHHRYAVAA